MNNCLVIDLKTCLEVISKLDLNGFKFLYDLLAFTPVQLGERDLPLKIQPQTQGSSKLDHNCKNFK